MFLVEMMMVVVKIMMMWASFKYDYEDNGYDHEIDDDDVNEEPHFFRFLPARRNTGALPSSLSRWRKYVGNRPDDLTIP